MDSHISSSIGSFRISIPHNPFLVPYLSASLSNTVSSNSTSSGSCDHLHTPLIPPLSNPFWLSGAVWRSIRICSPYFSAQLNALSRSSMHPINGSLSPKIKYGTGIRTASNPHDLIVTKSRSVMYSLRWILILASYTSFGNCLGSQYSSSAVVPSNNAGFIHFSRTSQFPKLTPFTFINVHPTFLFRYSVSVVS